MAIFKVYSVTHIAKVYHSLRVIYANEKKIKTLLSYAIYKLGICCCEILFNFKTVFDTFDIFSFQNYSKLFVHSKLSKLFYTFRILSIQNYFILNAYFPFKIVLYFSIFSFQKCLILFYIISFQNCSILFVYFPFKTIQHFLHIFLSKLFYSFCIFSFQNCSIIFTNFPFKTVLFVFTYFPFKTVLSFSFISLIVSRQKEI
jgi:hypothetical protein